MGINNIVNHCQMFKTWEGFYGEAAKLKKKRGKGEVIY